MEGGKQPHIAAGEATIREVNEGIERGRWPGEEDTPVGFRCECGRIGCNQLVELTAREYERIRSQPAWFVVAPGHETPGVETVIATRPCYVIIEKRAPPEKIAGPPDPSD